MEENMDVNTVWILAYVDDYFKAKAQIETEKQNAIADIRQQVSVLSVSIAEKILRQKLSDDKSQMAYVDKLLDDVSSDAK